MLSPLIQSLIEADSQHDHVSFDPRPSQIQFARAIRSNFPAVKIKQIREWKNNTDFFTQPEDLTSRECLMMSLNLNQAFPNAKVNARNTLPVYRGCPAYEHKLAEASKKINKNKFSALANKFKPQAITELTPSTEKIAVLEADVLNKNKQFLTICPTVT